ncbi:MAG TPA: pre-16S rRNA-processing nuclease YqgF [Candidatus Atribacteria bacterium]|nr:pre-16S rRNA-processing nuclease YqgF [Candidatus Atribacteria bacterium]
MDFTGDHQSEKTIFSIDPGREKVGVAILSLQGEVLFHDILPEGEIEREINILREKYRPFQVVVGNSTGREKIMKILEKMNLSFTLVDEHNSSEEARKLYFQAHPPRGWRKIVPLSFLYPDEAFDDWQAVVIGRRYLNQRKSEENGREK